MNGLRQREPRYENRAYLDLCHGAPCEYGITGCTGGTREDRPSVPCHPNWLEDGKGVGMKAHDHLVAPGCPDCHWQLDYGTMLTTEEKKDLHRMACQRWQTKLLVGGRVKLVVQRRSA